MCVGQKMQTEFLLYRLKVLNSLARMSWIIYHPTDLSFYYFLPEHEWKFKGENQQNKHSKNYLMYIAYLFILKSLSQIIIICLTTCLQYSI